jgi:hypothetical protein
MKKLAALCVLSLALTQVVSADDTNTFSSKQYGFTIDAPLPTPPANAEDDDVIFVTFEADNFTVEIDCAFNASSLQDFDKELSKTFKKDSLKKKTVNADSLVYETVEKNDDHEDIHTYTKYIKKGSYIFSATGTAYTEDWDKAKVKLMAYVDSFKLAQ